MKRIANSGVDMKELKTARLLEPGNGAVLAWMRATPHPTDCLRMSTRRSGVSVVSVVSVVC